MSEQPPPVENDSPSPTESADSFKEKFFAAYDKVAVPAAVTMLIAELACMGIAAYQGEPRLVAVFSLLMQPTLYMLSESLPDGHWFKRKKVDDNE